jgi:UDP-N-acetyl-D-mannosaminuronate dehydrogenase
LIDYFLSGAVLLVKEKVLVIGLGEIGLPLYELFRECNRFLIYGIDVDEAKMLTIEHKEVPNKVDIMHICIPFIGQDEFVNLVLNYIFRFKPKLVIINSTISPRTTEKIKDSCSCLVAHSPVRGVHINLEHMKWELKRWTKYVGGTDSDSTTAACKHFELAGFKTKVLKSCLETEIGKLFETTYRAWMISCFQEMHRIARFFKADFNDVTDFLEDTHLVRHDRPIMFPDVIGGHCLIHNAELLLKSYNSKFLQLIFESNERRKEEVKDKNVKKEIEKIRNRVRSLKN